MLMYKQLQAKTVFLLALFLLVASLGVEQANAAADSFFSTDRFGYTGVVKRYGSLSDAQNGTNQVGTDIAIGNRDLAIDISTGNYNVIMGSWWYSTEGSQGYGNTTGNSGRGFLQLYDSNSITDTSTAMSFSNFDGTYWTDFNLDITGENATYDNSYARFWIDYQGGGADKVSYYNYHLSLTAGGLQGVETSQGVIESFVHPTSVTGSFTGLFENVSTTYPENNGFYTFELALNMTNWAWDNREDLNPDAFSPSYAAVTPIPGAVWLLGSGLLGIIGIRRRRK